MSIWHYNCESIVGETGVNYLQLSCPLLALLIKASEGLLISRYISHSWLYFENPLHCPDHVPAKKKKKIAKSMRNLTQTRWHVKPHYHKSKRSIMLFDHRLIIINHSPRKTLKQMAWNEISVYNSFVWTERHQVVIRGTAAQWEQVWDIFFGTLSASRKARSTCENTGKFIIQSDLLRVWW